MSRHRKFTTICFAAVLALGLAACGGGDDETATVDPTPPVVEPTPYEKASAAIAAADTAEAAQAAYDAVKDDVTASQGGMLQMKVNERIAAIQMVARAAEQKTALMTAASNVDTSDLPDAEAIVAAKAAIAALQKAIDDAADVSDADKAMYQTQLDAANTAVMTAQSDLDTDERMKVQSAAISTAVTAARGAVGMVADDSGDADVTAADAAIAALQKAIDDAADLPEGNADVASAEGTLETLKMQLASAKTSRMAAMEKVADEQRMARIDVAKDVLTEKEYALKALADDATDEMKLAAQRMVEAAADNLRDVLRMNGGSDADIEAAIRTSAEAKIAADVLQRTITAKAEAEEQRKMDAIKTAQTTLTDAEKALAELGEDATDKQKRDAHRDVEMAAATLVQVLKDNDGTEDQIAAAEGKRDSAKMVADELTSPIEVAAQVAAINTAIQTAASAVDGLHDKSSDTAISVAEQAVADAKKAVADAGDIRPEQTAAFNLAISVIEGSLGSKKTSIMAAREEDKTGTEMAGTATAKLIASALMSPADEPVGDATDARLTAVTAEAERTASKTTITVTGPTAVGTGTVGTGDFKSTGDMPASVGSGWYGDTQTRGGTGTNPLETVIVYTDIEAPETKSVKFTEYYGTAGRDGVTGTIGDDGVLTLAAFDPDNASLFKSSMFPSGPRMKYTYGEDDDDKADARADEGGIAGSFNGVRGVFTCESDCEAQTDQKGMLQRLAGSWSFDADADSATVQDSTPDEDYLYFGWWVEKTKGVSSDSYAFHAFYGGAATYEPADTVVGKAMYKGPAAGMYVTKTFAAGGLDSAASGTFTASAELEADFGAADAAGMLSGKITDFMASGASVDWEVELMETVIDDDISHTTKGTIGDASGEGTWSANFYEAPDSQLEADGDLAHPGAVAGEFDAHLPAAHISGAFGAELQ